MRRRLILVGVLAVALAGCGGSSTPSPSASGLESSAPSTGASSSAAPLASALPTPAPTSATPVAGADATAVCDGISLRKLPKATGARVKSINTGTVVHVAARVTGTAYTAGACGNSGDTWLKIDKVGGKTAKAAFGVSYVYAAAGFFQ